MLRTALACAAALASLAVALPAGAKPTEIFPLEQVRRGQTGYGMTTMAGTTPERFSFEVLGVLDNYLPKMDIILVKSDDPKLQVSGFWRGMSGSPLYVNGKLMCAFSYGFRFNKLAIGGCTPIHYMMREGFDTPRRLTDTPQPGEPLPPPPGVGSGVGPGARSHARVAPRSAATLEEWLRVAPEGTASSALGQAREPWLLRAPLPQARTHEVAGEGIGLVAAAVPLAMSGFSAPAFAVAQEVFRAFPVEPMRAGGTGRPNEGPSSFVAGGAIGVHLIRGDMSAAATGTVSYVEDGRVLGFGHPLFQAGELYAPVSAAQVHTVIPSAMHAFVVASPLREIGSLVQDRQSTIMADTRFKTSMIPVDIYVETARGKDVDKGEFHVEVLDNRFMTGSFAGMAAMAAISHYLPDRDRATVYMESTVEVRGFPPLTFVDYLNTEDGASSAIGGARGLRVLAPLLNNPFAPVTIERLTLRARIRYGGAFGNIEELRLPTVAPRPGQRSYIDVLMRTYDGVEFVEKVPFDVPEALAGSIVKLQVTAGDAAGLDAAPPENLAQLMSAFRKLLPGNVFAVTLYSADEGVAIDGQLIRDLPPSALDRLRPQSSTPRAAPYRWRARSVYPSRRVINGQADILIQIADE